MNAANANKARCGAKRSDGLPCQDTPMENGRCYRHGGRTPKGDAWHKPIWPDPARPDAEQRLQAKLRTLEKRATKRRRVLKSATKEEREKYAAWLLTHKPTSTAARARARADRNASQWLAQLVAAQPETPPDLHLGAKPMLNDNTLPADTAAAVEANLAYRIRTEGLPVAYETALEICRDKKATPAARATASGWIFRVAGFSAANDGGSGKQLYEMTADELAAEAARVSGLRADLEAKKTALDAADDEPAPGAFD